MKMNNYIIASLPDLLWDSELPGTLVDFLEENKFLFEPYRENIDKILMLNDIKNIELILKSRMPIPEELRGNRGREIDFYRDRVLDIEEIEKFLSNPSIFHPDGYPEFMVDYLEKYKDDADRLKNIESLYIQYFDYLQHDESGFFRFYARIATTIRTVLAALRIQKMGLPLEGNLKGDYNVVQTILENRTTSDLGLKSILPEIHEFIMLMNKEPLELEKELDRIRFMIMEDVGQESLFGDHVIYSYIIGFMVRNRWNSLDFEAGEKILETIVKG